MRKRLLALLLVLCMVIPMIACAEDVRDFTETIGIPDAIEDALPEIGDASDDTIAEADDEPLTVPGAQADGGAVVDPDAVAALTNVEQLMLEYELTAEEICAILEKTEEEINAMPISKLDFARSILDNARIEANDDGAACADGHTWVNGVCSVCSVSSKDTVCAGGHTWSNDDGVCTVCDYVCLHVPEDYSIEGEPDWLEEVSVESLDGQQHKKSVNNWYYGYCTICGACCSATSVPEEIIEDHIDEDEDFVCDVCGAEITDEVEFSCADGHTWDNGICTVCGASSEDTLCFGGHTWVRGICITCGVNSEDKDCADGHSYWDGVCIICGASDPDGDSYSCDDNGHIWNNGVCVVCGVKGVDTVCIGGHTWQDASCTVCRYNCLHVPEDYSIEGEPDWLEEVSVESLDGQQHKKSVNNWYYGYCTICGACCSSTCVPEEIIEDHTDEDEDFVCDVCGAEITDEEEASGTCGENATWTLDENGVLTISGTGEITCGWDDYIDQIIQVVINDGIESIGYSAFDNCENLVDVTIPDSVTSIGESTFLFCSSLERVELGNGITSIENEMFADCPNLTNVVIPDSITSIGERAFLRCNSLESVTIPESVTAIGYSAFLDCNRLKSIKIPSSVIEIGEEAIGYCSTGECDEWDDPIYGPDSDFIVYGYSSSAAETYANENNLKFVVLSDSSTYSGTCGENATWTLDENGVLTISGTGEITCGWDDYKDQIIQVIINEGIDSIGESSFEDCTNLTDVAIPNGVTAIGDSAFSGSGLTGITIPESVTTIEDFAFNATGITGMDIPNGVMSIGYAAFANCENLVDVTIPDSVTSIGESTFLFCSSLERVELGNGITSIENEMFADCPNLTNVAIPDSITSIGERAFLRCNSLESVTIPESVTAIGYSAFLDCNRLKSIKIPSSVIEIGEEAIGYCDTEECDEWDDPIYGPDSDFIVYGYSSSAAETYAEENNLKFVVLSDSSTYSGTCGENATWTLDENGLLTISGTGEITCGWDDYKYLVTCAVISEGIETIGEYTFEKCTMTSISIPESVNEIKSGAFLECTHLSAVTIPEGVSIIGEEAFRGCTSLEHIIFPDSLKIIDCLAFSFCSSIKEVELPSNLQEIRNCAFEDCPKLEKVTLPDGLQLIRRGAFDFCGNLKSIVIPEQTCLEEDAVGNSVLYYDEDGEVIGCGMDPTFTIYGFTGSYAEEYAAENNLIFISKGKSTWNLEWIIEGDELRISGSGSMLRWKYSHYDEDLECYTMPWHDNASNITSVVIGEGVTDICDGAFKELENLTIVTLPSTLTEFGDEAFLGCTGLESITIPATVTKFGNDVFSDCDNLKIYGYCGSAAAAYAANCEITFVMTHLAVTDAAVAATCTEAGLTEGSHCSVCDEVLVAQETIPATGHTIVTDAAVAATCTEAGLTEGSHCSVCDEVLVAQETIPATGHTIVTDAAVAATCTTTGLTEGSHCSVCDEVLVAQETIPATGHTIIIDAAVAATCTETGLTEGTHCSVCDEVLVAQETIPATGHTIVTDAAVAATCTETGLTEGSHCSVCDEVLTAQNVIPAKGHIEVIDAAVAATYQTTGLTEGKHCSVCGTVLVAQTITPVLFDIVTVSGKMSTNATLGHNLQINLVNGLAAVSYKSSSEKILKVTGSGLITPVKAGSAKVTVTLSDKKTIIVTVTVVDPTMATSVSLNKTGTATLYLGEILNLIATMQPSTATNTLTWKSSSTGIVNVDANGVLTPVKEGTATITVTTSNGKSASLKVTVVDPTQPASIAFTDGAAKTVDIHGGPVALETVMTPGMEGYEPVSTLTWKSSSTKIAKIDANGVLTPVKEGTATITVTTSNGKKATLKVTVADPSKATSVTLMNDSIAYRSGQTVTLHMGDTLTLEAVMAPETATSTLKWKTSSAKYAALSETSGSEVTVSAMKVGTATITVTASSGKSATLKIKVTK